MRGVLSESKRRKWQFAEAAIAWSGRTGVSERQFQFKWNEVNSSSHVQMHGVSLERAAAIFYDPRILTVLYWRGKRWGVVVGRIPVVGVIIRDDENPSHFRSQGYPIRGAVL